MNSYQTRFIRDNYQGVPTNRGDQEDLIRLIYPGGTLQRRPLAEASDAQVFRVAERLYWEAMGKDYQEKVLQPLPSDHQYDPHQLAQVQRDWEQRLYEMFNIPPDQHAQVNPAELEARLLE